MFNLLITKIMSDDKVVVVPERDNDNSAFLNAMNNNQWTNNPFMYLIWLWFMRGFNNDGDKALLASILALMNDKTTSDLLMSAIQGNTNAIGEFSTRTGVGINDIIAGITNVNNNIQSQGYLNQLANCLQTNTLSNGICSLSNSLDRNAASIEYNTQKLTCDLSNTIRDTSTANTNAILAKLDLMTTSGMQDKINSLTAELASANARAERQAELAPIVAQLNSIRSALPSTTTIQYPQLTAIPTTALYGYSPYTTGVWG